MRLALSNEGLSYLESHFPEYSSSNENISNIMLWYAIGIGMQGAVSAGGFTILQNTDNSEQLNLDDIKKVSAAACQGYFIGAPILYGTLAYAFNTNRETNASNCCKIGIHIRVLSKLWCGPSYSVGRLCWEPVVAAGFGVVYVLLGAAILQYLEDIETVHDYAKAASIGNAIWSITLNLFMLFYNSFFETGEIRICPPSAHYEGDLTSPRCPTIVCPNVSITRLSFTCTTPGILTQFCSNRQSTIDDIDFRPLLANDPEHEQLTIVTAQEVSNDELVQLASAANAQQTTAPCLR